MTLIVRTDLIDMEGCRREAWRLLGRISTQISEASGQSIGGRVSVGKPQSSAPSGPHGETFEARWLQRFHRAWDDSTKLRTECIVCSASLARELGQLRSWARDHLLTDAGYRMDHDGDAVRERLVDCYVGWSPEDVAAVETAIGTRCDTLWVQRERRRNATHPQTGEPAPVGDDLLAKVRELSAAGKSLRVIGQEVGVSKTTVDRVLKQAAA